MRTMSASRTPNTSTLNSRDFMMGHNTSTSSGSHILENASTPKDSARRGDRVETAEVHDGSSQSGKSLGSPKKEHANATPDGNEDEEMNHTERYQQRHRGDHEYDEALDHVDTTGYSHYSKSNDTSQSADQNANDNDDNVSHDSYHLHDDSNVVKPEQAPPSASQRDQGPQLVKQGRVHTDEDDDVFAYEGVEGGPPSYEFTTEKVHEETKHADVLTNEVQMSEVVNGNLEISKFRDTIEMTSVERRVDTYKVQATVVKERVTGSPDKVGEQNESKCENHSNENVRVEKIVIKPGEKLDTQAVVQEVLNRVMESENQKEARGDEEEACSVSGSTNDIHYVLHRRCAESTQTEVSTPPTVPQPITTQKTSPKMPPRSPKPSPLGQLNVSPHGSPVTGDRSPSRSPRSPRSPMGDRSPGMGRSFEFIKRKKLPPRDSYSSADDSLSPSFEKEIFEHLRLKQEADSRLRSTSSGSEENEDKKRREHTPEGTGPEVGVVVVSTEMTSHVTQPQDQTEITSPTETETSQLSVRPEDEDRTTNAICADSIPVQVLITCPSSECLPERSDHSPVQDSSSHQGAAASVSDVMVSSASSLTESLEDQLQQAERVTDGDEDFLEDEEVDRVRTPESMSDDLAQKNSRSNSLSSLTSSESGVGVNMSYQITCPPELQPNESLDRMASTRSSSQSSLETNTSSVEVKQSKPPRSVVFAAGVVSPTGRPFDSPLMVPVPPLQISPYESDEDDMNANTASALMVDTVLHISTSDDDSDDDSSQEAGTPVIPSTPDDDTVPAPAVVMSPAAALMRRQESLPTDELIRIHERQPVTFSTFRPPAEEEATNQSMLLSPTQESDSDMDSSLQVLSPATEEDDVNRILSDHDAVPEESESEELPPPPPPEELELEMVAESVLESVFEQVREVQMAQAKAALLQESAREGATEAQHSPASSISSDGGHMMPERHTLAEALRQEQMSPRSSISSDGAGMMPGRDDLAAALREEQQRSTPSSVSSVGAAVGGRPLSRSSSISSDGARMMPTADELADTLASAYETQHYAPPRSDSLVASEVTISDEQRESIQRYFAQYQVSEQEALPPPPPMPLDYESIHDDDQSESSISEALGYDESIDSEDMLEPLERLNQRVKGQHADSDTDSSSESEGSEDLEIGEPVVIQRQINRHSIGIEVTSPKRSEFRVDVPDQGQMFGNPSAQGFDGQFFSNPYAQFSPDRPDQVFDPSQQTNNQRQGGGEATNQEAAEH